MHKFFVSFFVIWFTVVIISACGNTQAVAIGNVNSLPQSVIDDLMLSDTSSLTIENCVDRLTDINEPTRIRQGKVVPSSIVLFVDFTANYIDPRDYPLEAICTESGYGIYLGTDQFELPIDADIWTIELDQ